MDLGGALFLRSLLWYGRIVVYKNLHHVFDKLQTQLQQFCPYLGAKMDANRE